MRRTRLLTAGTVAALAATVLLFGGVLRPESSAPAVPAEDARTLSALGLEYQQRARETADASYLAKSEVALRRARALAPNDPTTIEGLAALALARHRFHDALALARRAERLTPGETGPLPLLGDALLELGRYDAAFRMIDRFARLKPGLAAYARVAYARELLGDRDGAVAAMRLAVEASSGRSEPAAWAHVELGKLLFGQGDLKRAEREYRAALASFPGYVHALDGLAHVQASRGDLSRAIELAERANAAVPLPQLVTTLGDLYRVAGRQADAGEQYGLIDVTQKLLGANGVRTDLELALFDVDHGVDVARALARARAAHRVRPSIQADDVLAWALARNGRCVEARRWSQRALRLGTRDASLFFHRGMIERCLGRPDARMWFRRAVALNPHFSLVWAPVAKGYAR
jgi:tetratricopeptide (TPR) repeat protein